MPSDHDPARTSPVPPALLAALLALYICYPAEVADALAEVVTAGASLIAEAGCEVAHFASHLFHYL